MSGRFDASISRATTSSSAADYRRSCGLAGVVLCFGYLGDQDAGQTDPDEALDTLKFLGSRVT